MISRRMLLTTGAVGIVVIGAGVANRNLHANLNKARAPWSAAGSGAEGGFGDPRLNALSFAILAPNPHNRQPWLARLDGDDRLTLMCDRQRLLPETDPLNRQIVIGLGAFLELLRQAAAESGYRLDIAPFPDGAPQTVLDDRPIATVAFIKDDSVERDPLFSAVLERRTVRTPFDETRQVSTETFNLLDRALRPSDGEFEWVSDKQNVSALKDICNRGWLVELENPKTHHESTALTRVGAREVAKNPDGISLSGLMVEGARLAGVLTREKMNDPASKAFSETRKFYQNAINTAQAFGWLSTGGNSRLDQLNVGAGWVRLHLAATQAGLAMHPLSQVLQEFPEMTELYDEFHDFVQVREPARVQGLFRFGYAKYPSPAPRWPLETRLVDA